MRRTLAVLVPLLACALPLPRERPWRPADRGDKWTQLALATVSKRVAEDVTKTHHGIEPDCLRRLDGYDVTVSAFESYRRVEVMPKGSCFAGVGGGFIFVVQGDRIIEAAIVE